MRFDTLFFAAAAVAVLTVFAGNDVQAQSGSRAVSAASSALSGFQGAPAGIGAPSFSAPNIGSAVQGFAQGQGFVQGQGVVESFPQIGGSSYFDGGGQYSTATQYASGSYGAPTQWAPEYVASPSSYPAQRAVQTSGCKGCRGKGSVFTGQINGGCRDCVKQTPIRTAQDYSAVPSCCGELGQLDIPSLFTPPRLDRAPIGKAVGRPLFGQWQGY